MKLRRPLLAGVLCLCPLPLPAATAVSNLAQTFSTTTAVGKTNGFDFQLAISFTTGPAIAEFVSITLNGFSFGTQPVSGLTFALYSSLSTSGPSGLVATLAGNPRPNFTLGAYTYTPSTSLTLAPNTTYWLVASAPTTAVESAFSWRATASTNEDPGGLAGWTVGNVRWLSNNGGATWIPTTTPLIPQFQITTTDPTLALTLEPTGQTLLAGSSYTLFALATGNPAPTYQWRKEGVAIPGATNGTLVLNSVTRSDAGNYSVVVTNRTGALSSLAVFVDVVPASWLSNISVRTTLAAGQVLIVGAVVSGGFKNVLVRAAGPALNTFNLPGMADPRLDLYTNGTVPIMSNEDWPASLAPTFASVAAFPFPSASRDAALTVAINGPFTVQARGTGAGAVLVEAYDLPGGPSPRLVNFSARNRVGTGGDILITGISLSGTGSKQVLIRAIGPGLAALGVPGTLLDPRLQIFNGAGAIIATNDNWDSALAPTFAQVAAFALPANSRDSAILATLDAGTSYTLQVSGADGGTGDALIEVYEIF